MAIAYCLTYICMKERTSASAGRPRNLEEMLLLQSVKYFYLSCIAQYCLLPFSHAKIITFKPNETIQLLKLKFKIIIKPLNRVQVRIDNGFLSTEFQSQFLLPVFFNPKKYISSHYLILCDVLSCFFLN